MNQNINQQPEEVTLDDLKEIVALHDALLTLEKSRAFKKLILKEYFEGVPVQMAAPLNSPHEQVSKGAHNAIAGVGALKAFFAKIHRDGVGAKEVLEAWEEEQRNPTIGSDEE